MSGDPFEEALALTSDLPTDPPTAPRRTSPGRPTADRTGHSTPDRTGHPTPGAPAPGRPTADHLAPSQEGTGRHPRDPHRSARSWSEARALARRAARRPLSPVTLPLEEALHHVLAAPLPARTDLPPFDTSAMDGWAVAGPGPWQLPKDERAVLLAGQQAAPRPLPDGAAVPIATGARLPPGATAVLRTEHGEVRAQDRQLHAVGRAPLTGTDIRPRGQECRSGDVLLSATTVVTPTVLGLAAAAGYDLLTVTPRPSVEILVLGEELLRAGTPRDDRIRDALGPMLPSWLAALGASPRPVRRLGDDAEALYRAVCESDADLVLTTGGTAAGPVDHLHATLHRIGVKPLVDGVGVRPGRPMLLAETQRGRLLVGLPGNPLAAVSGMLTLVAPLVRRLADRPEPSEPPYGALTEAVTGHSEDVRLVPVITRRHGTAPGTARPLRYTGPAMLRGIATATDLAVIPPGGASAGEQVRLLDLPWT